MQDISKSAAYGHSKVPAHRQANVTVIGVLGDQIELICPEARIALENAECICGSRKLLKTMHYKLSPSCEGIRTVEYGHNIFAALETLAQWTSDGMRVAILASGDPGFFGILRALRKLVSSESIAVYPSVSSISMAFARIGVPWDDATIVSAHGRPSELAIPRILSSPKSAILTSPSFPPQELARELLARNVHVSRAYVCSSLCTEAEYVKELSLEEMAKGDFDPVSVSILIGVNGAPIGGYESASLGNRQSDAATISFTGDADQAAMKFGLPDTSFQAQGGLITGSEVRAIILSKLELPAYGVLWDVGAGSGSVAIESAKLSPGLTVLAIDKEEQAIRNIQANALSHGVRVHTIHGNAPDVFDRLPAPNRVFVGGGKLPVLERLVKMEPGPRKIVASYIALDRAVTAAGILGSMVQVSVSETKRLPDGSLRLVPNNPVFLVYGPVNSVPIR
jgi:precorrin-6Y C5,15-methyltransferase (decarboxylating)